MAKLSRTRGGVVLIGVTDTVSFDATIRESHDQRYQVTRHEVEEGADIGDHVRVLPRELQFVASIGAVGLDVIEGKAAGVDDGREFATIRQLERMAARREIVTVRCYLGRFEGYVIESVSTPVARGDGSTLTPTITLVEYRSVEGRTVEAPDLYAQEVRRIAEQAADDSSERVTVEDVEDVDNRSFLARTDDALDGAVTNSAARGLELTGVVNTGGGTAP